MPDPLIETTDGLKAQEGGGMPPDTLLQESVTLPV